MWFTASLLKNSSLCHSLEQLSQVGLACFDFKVNYKTYINKEVLCEKSIHACLSRAFCLQLRASSFIFLWLKRGKDNDSADDLGRILLHVLLCMHVFAEPVKAHPSQ